MLQHIFIGFSALHKLLHRTVHQNVQSLVKRSLVKSCAPVRKSSGMTVACANQFWSRIFLQNDIPEAETSVAYILCSVLGIQNILYLKRLKNRKLTKEEYENLQEKTRLRLQRMPLQYILGEWDFCGLTLKMSPSVFIPRPETENLVSIASDLIWPVNKPARCLEFGCGSGAITLALLSKHNKLQCVAIDANLAAIFLAQTNAKRLGFIDRALFVHALLQLDGTLQSISSPIGQDFDILVANPPYIPTEEIQTLAPEIVRYEDRLALDGGLEGTDLIATIINHAPRWLKRGSFIVLEIDPRQTRTIQAISQQSGSYIGNVDVRKDCFGVERFVVLRCK